MLEHFSNSEAIFEESASKRPLLLDGATGTELGRRGIPTGPPLWSCSALIDAPDEVEEVHREHADAGADLIVAHTFRCGPRALAKAGIEGRGQELVSCAVSLARKTGRIVATSVAPVEDCYQPEAVPSNDELVSEHGRLADWIAEAQPDLVWIETMNTAREAGIAAQAATERGLPFAANFVLSEEGTLLSGEPIKAGIEAVCSADAPPRAIGINCIPPKGATRALPRLLALTAGVFPVAVYAHVGNLTPIPGWSYTQSLTAAEYAEAAVRWIDMGARVVGGCCGTTAEHVAAMRATIDRAMALEDPRWRT